MVLRLSSFPVDVKSVLPVGSATLNFGSIPSVETSVVVTGQAAIQSGSQIDAWFMASSTSDNNAVQHQMAATMVQLMAGAIVAGTGFTIYAISTGGLATGQFIVQWRWR